MKRFVANSVLLFLSVVLAVVLAEAGFRVILEPVDFLQPTIVEDPVLGHRIDPNSGGHDAFGFRNAAIPDRSEVVAVGDSMTYGVAASQASSWPSQLAGILNTSVYNLSLGGYGPIHYLELTRRYALPFQPDWVVVGVYLGNDLMDSFNLVYGNDHWRDFRVLDAVPEGAPSNSVFPTTEPDSRFLGDLRHWLSQRSILYSVLVRSPVGNLVRHTEAQQSGRLSVITASGQETYFDLESVAFALNLSDPRIAEGLRLTELALTKIIALCRRSGVNLSFVFVPTKEMVFRHVLNKTGLGSDDRSRLLSIVEAEGKTRRLLMQTLASQGALVVDPLAVLENAAVGDTPIYPENDGHPNGVGYGIIAGEVAKALATPDAAQ